VKDWVQWGLSERRGCAVIGIGRSSVGYQPRASKDEELLRKLKKLALRHPRYGYRRIWALIRREGEGINVKKVLRLWRKAGLALKRRPSRIRRKGHRVEGPLKATHPRHVVTYDFMFDRTIDGRALKILTVVDEFTREALAIAVGYRMTATQVIWVLARAFKAEGWPEYLRSDNGPEFIAEALETWLKDRGVVTHHIDPASPWQNAYGESFNGKLRAECLDLEVFETDTEARRVLEAWRIQYNVSRPHSSLGYRTPAEVRLGWKRKGSFPFARPRRASRVAGRGRAKGKNYC
jgi:putative transposase